MLMSVGLFGISRSTLSEELGKYELSPLERKEVNFDIGTAQVLKVTLEAVSGTPKDKAVIKIGQGERTLATCGGAACTAVTAIFCPSDGALSGYIQNFTDSVLPVTIRRLECEGKERKNFFCPHHSEPLGKYCQ